MPPAHIAHSIPHLWRAKCIITYQHGTSQTIGFCLEYGHTTIMNGIPYGIEHIYINRYFHGSPSPFIDTNSCIQCNLAMADMANLNYINSMNPYKHSRPIIVQNMFSPRPRPIHQILYTCIYAMCIHTKKTHQFGYQFHDVSCVYIYMLFTVKVLLATNPSEIMSLEIPKRHLLVGLLTLISGCLHGKLGAVGSYLDGWWGTGTQADDEDEDDDAGGIFAIMVLMMFLWIVCNVSYHCD